MDNKVNAPKILMLACQEIIEQQNDGGKKISYRNFELLCRTFGNDNVTLMMYTNHRPSIEKTSIIRVRSYNNVVDRAFNVLCGRLFTNVRGEEKVLSFIKKNNIDILFLDRSLYGTLVNKLKAQNIECKVWVYAHNIETNYFRNKFKNNKLLSYIICKKVDVNEKITIQNADCLMGLTERDGRLMLELYGKEMKYIIPTLFSDVVDEQLIETNYDDTLHLLFLGSCFGPNYDGIKWFVDSVFDRLHNVDLTIVGKGFEDRRQQLTKDGIIVIGSVENLSDYYYKNYVMIMPIFYGDGQKVKTAEAMMYGKTILATDEALEGYEVDGVTGIYRCNSDIEFVDTINNLILDMNYLDNVQPVRNIFLLKYEFNNMMSILEPKLWKEWIDG